MWPKAPDRGKGVRLPDACVPQPVTPLRSSRAGLAGPGRHKIIYRSHLRDRTASTCPLARPLPFCRSFDGPKETGCRNGAARTRGDVRGAVASGPVPRAHFGYRGWRWGGDDEADGGHGIEARRTMTRQTVATAALSVPEAAQGPEPAWLAATRAEVHARFDQVLRVRELATRAGVHPVHLSRVFKRAYGCTLAEYQRRLRVAYACRVLTTTRTPLASVAFRTGFADQAHFTRRFKEVTGLAPGEYRRRVAG